MLAVERALINRAELIIETVLHTVFSSVSEPPLTGAYNQADQKQKYGYCIHLLIN